MIHELEINHNFAPAVKSGEKLYRIKPPEWRGLKPHCAFIDSPQGIIQVHDHDGDGCEMEVAIAEAEEKYYEMIEKWLEVVE